jgi:hypothetical protein
MIFRVTKKVQAQAGLGPNDLVDQSALVGGRDHEWYCSLSVVDRRKCLLFTHARSLFSFVVPAVRKADLADMGKLFRHHARAALAREQVAVAAYTYLLAPGPDQYGPTADRSILGSMNDFGRMFRYRVEEAGSLLAVDWTRVHDDINQSPMSYLNDLWPSRVLADLLRRVASEGRG